MTESEPGPDRVGIVGAGGWGTGLSLIAARNGLDVKLWGRSPEMIAEMKRSRRNPFYLSEFQLPELISATSSLEQAVGNARFVFLVVPSHAMREAIERVREYLLPDAILVSATKGVENDSLMRMSQVIHDVLTDECENPVVVLSGPSFAREVAKGDPTAVVAASTDLYASESVQKAFSSPGFRIYTNNDVVGVEIGAAVKNVVAIAAGVVRGLGFGTNSVAAIMTRGLAEITRLALALGARPETMAGLAGLGDLVLTCTGELSRNRQVGIELGRGRGLSEILGDMREVAEGIKTSRAIFEMSRRLSIEMPIISSVYQLLYEGKPALDAANELMGRPLKRE